MQLRRKKSYVEGRAPVGSKMRIRIRMRAMALATMATKVAILEGVPRWASRVTSAIGLTSLRIAARRGWSGAMVIMARVHVGGHI